MPTLFAIPKPFRNHIAVIQTNAIRSWTRLGGAYKVILFGDEEGTAQLAQSVGATYVPRVARNRYGTPLLNDLFQQAQQLSNDPILCYINADILLLDDFAAAVQRLARRKKRFLMVGQRWDFNQTQLIDFDGHWQAQLRDRVSRTASLRNPTAIDYFLFTRGLWGKIPPFAVGRTAFDNWLIYRARQLKMPVIDATPAVTAIHQNHDYLHAGSGYNWIWKGPEAKFNQGLAGGQANWYTIWDSTHVLTAQGIEPRRQTGLGGGIWSYRRSTRLGA